MKLKRGMKVRVTEAYKVRTGNPFSGGFRAEAGMVGVIEHVSEDYGDPDFEVTDYPYAVEFPGGDYEIFAPDEIEAVNDSEEK